MFEIGHIVQVADTDYIYTEYDRWAHLHYLDKYKQGVGIDKTINYRVIARGFHGSTKERVIYGITDDKHDYIIGEESLKLADEPAQYEWLWYGFDGDDCIHETLRFCKTKDEAQTEILHTWGIKFKKKYIHKVKCSKRKVNG